MLRYSRIIAIFVLSALLLSACNSKPDHRRYIPKDAALVAGINLSSLSKKIAWNMITGSKLFKEMEKRVPDKNGSDVMSGIDKAGIDVLNTFYVYLKTDTRFNTGMKVTALVPLNDASAWEAYIKKNFPKAEIKDHDKLKIATLDGNMYMGWNKNLLIIMNVLADNSADMTTEIDNAFSITDDNSIKATKNFEKLVSAGHDLSVWVNYDQIVSSYMNDGMASRMNGVSISKSLWKETAFACGFDFVKGKITGDMTYYTSKGLSDIYKDFGATNVSKDMIERMPAKDLNMMAAMHFSTTALKNMMDSTGILGLANSGLSSQGMNVDNILGAFSGDMAFAINNFSMTVVMGDDHVPEQSADYCMSYIMKINKKENFQQLMDFAKLNAGLMPMGEGYALPISSHDSVFVVANNDYAVFSNKYNNAAGILHGDNKGQKLPDALKSQFTGHPFAMFIDVPQTINRLNPGNSISVEEAAIYEESKKLLTDISFNGGEFKDDAMQAHLEINFTNKDESSIINLLNYGMKISDAMEKSRARQEKMIDSMAHSF